MAKIEIKYITKSVPLLIDKKDKHRVNDEVQKFWELRGINFKVNDGEGVGIIGDNGSGKAVLMRILAGKEKQTTGFITTDSRITYASCYALDPEKTGLDNIRQEISKAQIDEFKGDHYTNGIINFAEIGELLYRPVKEYSLGMQARLSLSIALFIDPEIVILDEVLSPLDRNYYFKAVNKIQQLKDSGVSFIVSEIRPMILETICEQTAWLQFGLLQDFGPTTEVLRQYDYALEWEAHLTLPEKNEFIAEKQREQVQFNIDKLYEVFKSEQFKHGYTRKDEPRMRKAFFVERGNDPVKQDKVEEKPQKEKNTNKLNKGWLAVIVIVILVGCGIFWYQHSNAASTSQSTASSATTKSSKSSSTSSADTSKALSSKQASESAASAASESAKQASESAKQASESSESAAKASSESAASLSSEQADAQTITVADGESLESLATKYATTVEKLQELNGLGSSVDITAGETLYVPK